MDLHQGAARVLLHRAALGVPQGLPLGRAHGGRGRVRPRARRLPAESLPVPASLQAPPLTILVPPATVPAGPPPDLVGPATGGGHAALSGGVPCAAVPVAAAPLAPAGLMAVLGGATGVKVAVAVVATVVAAGGGLAGASSTPIPPQAQNPAANRAWRPCATSLVGVARRRSGDAPGDDPRATSI